MPFLTAVVAKHLPYAGARTAVILCNATYLAIAIVFNGIWRYCISRNHHLLGKEVNPAEVQNTSDQYAYGPLVYVLCIILA